MHGDVSSFPTTMITCSGFGKQRLAFVRCGIFLKTHCLLSGSSSLFQKFLAHKKFGKHTQKHSSNLKRKVFKFQLAELLENFENRKKSEDF